MIIKTERGLTLIEVTFSMVIAAITILSLMMLFPKLKILVDIAHHKVAAVKACQSEIEHLRREGFATIVAGSSTSVVTLDNGENFSSTSDDLRAEITTTISNVTSGGVITAKKIAVQITWIEHHAVVSEYLDFVLYNNIQ